MKMKMKQFIYFYKIFVILFIVIFIYNSELNAQNDNIDNIDNIDKETKGSIASRGSIYDAKGRILAYSKKIYCVSVFPSLIKNKNTLSKTLSKLLNIKKSIIDEKIKLAEKHKKKKILIERDISDNQYNSIKKLEVNMPSLKTYYIYGRVYPNKKLAAHVIGYIESTNYEKNMSELGYYDYLNDEIVGKAGLEYQFEADLKEGNDIHTTINMDIQEIVEKAFNKENGAVVVLDYDNADILAMYSCPSFDPNIFAPPKDDDTIKNIFKIDGLLINKAISAQFPLGSNFKVVTAISALENEIITPKHKYTCKGYFKLNDKSRSYKCHYAKGHGTLDLVNAIKHSCNVYFYNLAYQTGVENISNTALSYGLGMQTGVDLPYEKSGVIPSSEWINEHRKNKWYAGETVIVGIGQGPILATPLQNAIVFHTIANGGKRYRPRIIKEISYEDGAMVFQSEVVDELSTPKAVLKTIQKGLELVPTNGGTAYSVFKKAKYKIAGKTGTAESSMVVKEKGKEREITHTWFSCYGPLPNPKIVVVVFNFDGYSGEISSAPIAKRIFDAYLKLKN